MKCVTLFLGLLLGFWSAAMAAQSRQESSGLKNAVILIVRHAEKPDSGNGLSPAGKQRAQAYIRYFTNFTVNSEALKLDGLFATADSKESHRPRLTLEPLSEALGVRIETRFKNKQTTALAKAVRAQPSGKHILICWRHGEIPQLLKALGADPAKLLPRGQWPDSVFGWVLQLRYDQDGRLLAGDTKRINDNLMPADSENRAPDAP